MKRNIFFLLILLHPILGFCQSGAYTDQLIGERIAVFYPKAFDAAGNLPSLALLNEPQAKGNIPSNWKVRPRFYAKNGKTYASVGIEAGTSLYGTGESVGKLLKNGSNSNLWNTDNYTYKADSGRRLYQSHPWVLAVRADGSAFGVLADNTWRQSIHLKDSIRFESEGTAFRMIIIERNSPQEVLSALTELIGKMPMPPLWSLGYQQCRFSYVPDTRIKSIADTFRLKRIPCDVIWMDIDYMDQFKIFTFDKVKIPDPKGVNDYLHNKGFKSVWMIDPGVKAESGYSVYDSGSKGNHWVQDKEGKEFNGKVWPGKCAFPDFTRPETSQWWGGLYKDYMATGVDGVWNDMNEPSVFDGPGGTMPDDNHHRGGGSLPAGSHLRYHNVYGMLMIKASSEAIAKLNPEKRPFVLSRSGYLGSHRYGATWTGDNAGTTEMMKMSIPMSINLGLSGQSFSGPDIGGFVGNTDAELYGQWIALGAFYPFSRGHASTETNNKEPWAFGAKIENVARVAMSRRYRLLPYLYTCFHQTSISGIPMMRPVFFADTKDLKLRTEEQSFLLGSDLLIVPQWAQNPSLPKGQWRNISLMGEAANDPYQPQAKLREGAVLPIGKLIQSTTEFKLDSVTLILSLDDKGKAKGQLYEDSGEGYGFQKGEFSVSEFSAEKKGEKLVVNIKAIEGKPRTAKRWYKIQVITDKQTYDSKWLSGDRLEMKIEK